LALSGGVAMQVSALISVTNLEQKQVIGAWSLQTNATSAQDPSLSVICHHQKHSKSAITSQITQHLMEQNGHVASSH